MIRTELKYHELGEFERLRLLPSEMTESAALRLHRQYRGKIDVEWPTPLTDDMWQLSAQGHVGVILVDEATAFRIRPKVPIQNVLQMLEYAYGVGLKCDPGLVTAAPIEGFYSRLASLLANRVLLRGRKGLYRAYVGQRDRLPYVRGRLDLRRSIRQPWDVALPCQFEDHTPDVDENRILAFTLYVVGRSAACAPEARSLVQQAYQGLRGHATLMPYVASDCAERDYSRLNDDYEPMHALCRFFLASCGPTHVGGEQRMLPFLLPMATVFEEFVAEWLARNLPEGIRMRKQRGIRVGGDGGLQFRVDAVLTDARTGQTLAVLDTKYKRERATSDDFHQIHSYARLMRSRLGVLVYPERLTSPLDVMVEGVRIRSLTFDLNGDLEVMGRTVLRDLLDAMR